MHIYWHHKKTTKETKKITKKKKKIVKVVSSTSINTITDITQFVTSIEWSGASTEASRTLVIGIVNNPYDSNSEIPELSMGDGISFYGNGKTQLFFGRITYKERNGEKGTESYTCNDYMQNMLKSNISHKYKKATAEAICKDACKRIGISTKNLSETKLKLNKLYCTDTPVYNVCMKAYKLASEKNGIKYFPYMSGNKFSVKQKGQIVGRGYNSSTKMVEESFLLSQDSSIITSQYTESIEDMVNKVAIYNKKGKQIGTTSNSTWVGQYGTYQATITVSKGNGKAKAKTKLKGKSTSMQLECIGDERCTAGAGIKIYDKGANIIGTFWIESDTHTWESGKHKMSLVLTLKNVMENPSVTYEKSSKNTKLSGSATVSSTSGGTATGRKIAAYAASFRGKCSYRLGCSNPKGLCDCSGFTMYVYAHFGHTIPHYSVAQAKLGSKISNPSKFAPGDIVIMHTGWRHNAHSIPDHVGIYYGDGKIIQVGWSGCRFISVSAYRSQILYARRII